MRDHAPARPVIASLDLGRTCGWAVLTDDGDRVASGVWRLPPRRGAADGQTYRAMCRRVRDLLDVYEPRVVAYERVRRHGGTYAAHVYGGLRAAMLATCQDRVPVVGLEVAAVKEAATGKGRVSKEEMIRAAVQRWGPVADDNEADALWGGVAYLTAQP